MKTILLTYLIFLSTIVTFGQVKEIYLNDDLNEISLLDFNNLKDPYKNFDVRFDMDTLIINVKVQRISKGQIAPSKLDSIRNELSSLSGRSIPKNDVLIINYYPGLDWCNSTGDKSLTRVNYKSFLKKLNKTEDASQFFVYKSPEGTAEYGEHCIGSRTAPELWKTHFFPSIILVAVTC